MRNIMHLGVGQVMTTVLTMLLSAAIARSLGASDFGLLYLLTTIATFAYVFVDWGHGAYVTREVAIRPERTGELLGSVLAVRGITALVMCAIAVGATAIFGYDGRTRLLAALLIVAWVPQFLGLSYSWIFRGIERMEYDAMLQIALKLGTLALAFSALALGGRVEALVAVYAIAGVVTLVVAIAMYRRLGFPRLRATRKTARELIWNGAPLMAMSLAIAVQPYIDANILYATVPQHVLGWYGAAWTVAGTLVAPAGIVGSAIYPQLSRAATDPGAFTRALRTAFRPLMMLAVLGGVGTYLFADFAIGVVYGGEKFGPAAATLKAFAPALVLIYLGMVLGYTILAAGKASVLAKAKIAAVVVTTALEWVLISWFQTRYGNGGIGIVLSLAGGELVMVTSAAVILRHSLDRGLFLDLFRALAAGGATILVMRALPAIPAPVAIPLCVTTFGGLLMATGLITRADVEQVVSRIGRRRSASLAGEAEHIALNP
jgi:O-antigen/teichoic acid export membrane protein